MDFRGMKRKELQALCKKHNLQANKTNLQMAESLASFLKVEEKPVESSGEIASVNGSAIVMKRAKKVRFWLEEEKTEIVDMEKEPDRKVVREIRRKSILKPQLEIPKLNVEEMGNSENQEEERDIPVRVTRSRARKLMEADVSAIGSPPVKKKKSRASNDSIKNICRSDKAPTVLNLLGDGVAESNVALQYLGPVRRSLRSREIDVYPERIDRSRRKTRKEVREDRNNGDEVEDLGVLMKNSARKRSEKMENVDVVAKRNLRSDELKGCVIVEEETDNALETEALKPLNRDSSSTGAIEQSLAQSKKWVSEEEVSAAKTESIAGVEIQDKNEILLQFAGKKSSVLQSDGENVVNVEGKRMSELPKGRRRPQRRAPKNKSFVPETETTSESKFQVQEENKQDLQVEEPTGDNVPRHESYVLFTKYETVVPSERSMLSKPKDRLRRSWRKGHENKSFAPPNRVGDTDDSCGGNKLGEQLELDEPVLEEDISLPKASGVNDEEEHWHKKSEDIVDDKEKTGSHSSKFSNLVNADVREQNCGKVVLTEEKESAVTMVENLSLNRVSDRDKETTKHADVLAEKVVDEDGKEPLEVPGTSEVSEDRNTCDTALLKFKAYIPTNSEDEANVATTEGNFACGNDTDFIDAIYSGYLETVLEEQDDLNCRVSPVHGLGNAVSDVCAFKDDELRTSHLFDQLEANAYEVESEKIILSFNEPVKQVLLEEAGEVVPERINYHGTHIRQSNHRENRKYREIPVIQQHVQIDCCATDREVEEYESFVCKEAIVEHEEADKLFKSLCKPVFDHAEACEEEGNLNEVCGVLQDDGNAISKNVTECMGFNTKTNYEATEICQVDPEANERTENVLDKYEEHQVNLQMTDNKTMMEAEEFIETIEDELKISELGKQKKDGADALVEELGKEGGGEATSMMAQESEFPGTCKISEDVSICGAPLLVSQENVTSVSAIYENKEGLAEKGKSPGPLQQIVLKELVDLTGGPPLWHDHVNAVSGVIVEENRSLEDKAATKENFDYKGGKCVADSKDNARISNQIVLVEPIDHGYQRERETLEEASKLFSDDIPFQVLIPIEQYNHLDNERNKEFSVSQHSAPACCSLNIEDKGFTCRVDLAKCKDSDGFVNTTYEPSLDHLPPKNGNSDETYDVLEYDGSGICKSALGDRDIKDSECTVETNDIWKVILDADDNTAVNAAESYLVHQVVKEVDNNIEIHKEAENDIEGVNGAGNNNMGECTATAEAECWHKDSGVLNENENAERCVSKLENVMQVPQTSEESSKSRVSKNEDLMEAKIYQMEKGVCFTDPEDEENKGNKVIYDPEPMDSMKNSRSCNKLMKFLKQGC